MSALELGNSLNSYGSPSVELGIAEYEGQTPPDELPKVTDLSRDFGSLLSDYSHGGYRAHTALEYAGHLKARFKHGTYESNNPEYAREQILPRLYIDLMILTAQRDDYHALIKHLGQRRTETSLPALHRLIGAKIEVQQGIGNYARLYPEKTGSALFGNISTMMHHGRRVLYGDEVTFDKAREQNLTQLLAILAEYKVLAALHEEWPDATFGTVEEDQHGTDIVVPSQVRDEFVALQVKSKIKADTQLTILDQKLSGIPEVRVPMNVEQNDPLSLNRAHSKILRAFVHTAPTHKLSIAHAA
jgi:hypothetical protein